MKTVKKRIAIASILVILLLALLVGLNMFGGSSKNNTNDASNSSASSVNGEDYILDGYPLDVVKLYDGITISSMKYFVNENPDNVYSSGFFDAKKNYYNVVFISKADKKTVFDYYRSLMSHINEDNQIDDTLEGVIGDYRVSISNYDDDTYYLQVHLASSQYSKTNKYHSDYPDPLEEDASWIEFENGYGKLNQKGGEIEYTKYYNIDSSKLGKDMKDNTIAKFYDSYKQKCSSKTDFSSDDSAEALYWNEGQHRVTATFKSDHGRIYIMIRRPM